jgi:hypothetical protein
MSTLPQWMGHRIMLNNAEKHSILISTYTDKHKVHPEMQYMSATSIGIVNVLNC